MMYIKNVFGMTKDEFDKYMETKKRETIKDDDKELPENKKQTYKKDDLSKSDKILEEIIEKSEKKLSLNGRNIFNAQTDIASDYDFIHSNKELDSIIRTAIYKANYKNEFLKFCETLSDKIDAGEVEVEDMGNEKVSDLLEDVCWNSYPELNMSQLNKVIKLSDHLDKNNLFNKNKLVLDMMESMYDGKVLNFLKQVIYNAKDEYKHIFFNTPLGMDLTPMLGWNVEQHIKYEQGEKEYVEKFFEKKYGKDNPSPKRSKGFYEENWDKHSWNYAVAQSIFEEFGVEIDEKQVKNLFSEKVEQQCEECKEHIRKLEKEDKELEQKIIAKKGRDTQDKE